MISFIWEGKQESYEKAFESTNKTLQANKEASINFDTTNNLYIEGDNIDALKLLEKEYANKIKMIYIDPPYNTGRKNLTYSDNFRYDKETNDNINWLNMIYPRLLLAKKLLTEDGVIFISIDDKQFADLKVICDEIFGAYNYTPFIWNKKNSPSGCTTLNKKIDIKTEYILCYQKNKNISPFNLEKSYYDNLLLNMTSSIGAADLRKLDMHNFFSSPKPVKLLKHLINMCTSTNDIVLDFFAGSSTTAHAVLELNKENKTNLSFIMVQKTEECATTSEAYKNGFKTISAIGLERIKRIGTILKEQCPELDTGFKYYKVI